MYCVFEQPYLFLKGRKKPKSGILIKKKLLGLGLSTILKIITKLDSFKYRTNITLLLYKLK